MLWQFKWTGPLKHFFIGNSLSLNDNHYTRQTNNDYEDIINYTTLIYDDILLAIVFGTACTASPSTVLAGNVSGVITSPFYPNNYPNFANCQWRIISQIPTQVSRHRWVAIAGDEPTGEIIPGTNKATRSPPTLATSNFSSACTTRTHLSSWNRWNKYLISRMFEETRSGVSEANRFKHVQLLSTVDIQVNWQILPFQGTLQRSSKKFTNNLITGHVSVI